jgi:hypothetical protein
MIKYCAYTKINETPAGVRVCLHLLDGSNIDATVPATAITPKGVKFICKDGLAKVPKSKVWTKVHNIYVG